MVVKGNRPGPTAGLRHVALFVEDLHAAEAFYVQLLGMEVEWRPDENNVYLSSGIDNLALHASLGVLQSAEQRLDHIGFIIDEKNDVDRWFDFLQTNGVPIQSKPKTHRDGARSFYCRDPAGTLVQLIYHPPISGSKFSS